MYLKEIEASGFKSFADKLKITLDDNITCIVGPNGSGKSNVVDAVRWVLGEQSVKSLRGEGSMSDVIFSGSKSRNSLNVANVTLTFDNTDHYLNVPYDEVAVKRRVYRTGENEYFINGEKCRLKDITDLFLDSGIGKESFNIISQGEVQKILSNSPLDRRSIFEEAAGVLKYKKRKEEALRKLDRTHDNLDRVEDIIAELEVQVGPLKEQSIRAKEYLEAKKNLEDIEVALTVYEIDFINEKYQLAKKKMEELNNSKLTLEGQNSDARTDQLKLDLLKLEETLSDCNRLLLEQTRTEEKLRGEKNMLKERSKYDAKDDRVHDQIASLKEAKLKVETEVALLQEQVLNMEQDHNRREKDQLTYEQNLRLLEEKRRDLEKERALKDRERLESIHRIQMLENSLENGSGLPNSVRAILNHPKLRGIHDVIGNLFQVDEKYSKAMEIALGASKQFIVVDDSNSAKDAIRYLKENKLGRATFFPLNVIKPKGVDYETLDLLKQESDFIDVGSNLITFDNEYRNIFTNQLGNVLIVRDIDAASRISKMIKERYKIVTLDGDVVHVGGSMTGGTTTFSKSMITERIELEKGKEKRQELEEVVQELDRKWNDQEQEISTMEQKVYESKVASYLASEELRKKKEEMEAKKEYLEEVTSELSSLGHVVDSSFSKEEERIMNAYYEAIQEKEKTQEEIKQKTKEKERLQQVIDELEAKNKMTQSNLKQVENQLKELEISTNRMDVQLDHYLSILSEDYELTYEKAKSNYLLVDEVDEARSKVANYKNRIKEIGMVNLAAIEEFERVNTRYEFLTKQKDDLLHAKDTLLEIIEEMDQVMIDEFKSTFDKIQVEFKNVFTQLFHGGTASLKLTDPDHLLETGIEIIASPPGKRLTSISLLSGGEKTLTAISLLFAILNVRTVPFCIFDEVEAALDEANVEHFGKYLEHYKAKTQFLLITHKKKTMEYANTLYGITMQESGVSKLVSVRFEEGKTA